MTEITDAGRAYWQYEYDVMALYLLPLLREWGVQIEGATVLDIGCGDGGGIGAMADAGMRCRGFDIEQPYIELAKAMKGDREIEFTTGDIYAAEKPFAGERFDIVILHDVFEHIERKEEVLEIIKSYLALNGRVVITFPPYFSAFGAHQQFLRSKLGRVPFFHLVPFAVSSIIPRLRGEDPRLVAEIRKLRSLRMGIGRFESLAGRAGYGIERKKFYLVGPNHIRFGLVPVAAGVTGSIPVVRELLVSGVVYLLGIPR